MEPEAQAKKMRAARKHFHKMYAIGAVAAFSESFGGLLESNGTINLETCRRLFSHFDDNRDGHIEKGVDQGARTRGRGEEGNRRL